MTKTNKKQKNLANPVELQEHPSHRIVNAGEVQIYPAEEIKESPYKQGDAVVWKGVTYRIVEVLEYNRWHFKNVNAPFNSCIVTADLVAGQYMNAPDLLVREDESISL